MSGGGAFLSGLASGIGTGEDIKDRRKTTDMLEMLASARTAPRGLPGVEAPGEARNWTYDGKIGDRVSHAYNRFRAAGLSHIHASALTGNLMQESGADINPAAVGDGGNAFGAPQWNGDRRRGYLSYASEHGSAPTDFDTQIDYLLHEGQTSEKTAWDAILATSTVEDAARVASERFWRPGAPHLSRRVGYATAVHDKFYQPESTGPSKRPRARGVAELVNKGDQLLDRFYRKKEA